MTNNWCIRTREQQENPDEDEVLRLLGISKEKTEQPTTPEASTNDDQLRREINDLEKIGRKGF